MISEKVNVNGGYIFYESRGDGLPVVLIHAGYLDRRMWDSQFEMLSEMCQAIRYDVRGFGKSSGAESTYSDAVDLKSVLDTLEIDSAVVVGVSNGGRIALDFAVEYPARAKALVLMNFGVAGYEPAGDEEKNVWAELEEQEKEYISLIGQGKYRDAAAIDVDIWTPLVGSEIRKKLLDIAEENVRKQSEFSDEFNSGRLQVSPAPPAFERLGELKMPVLMILGDKDLQGQQLVVKRVHGMVPGSELVTIEGADHIASLSKKEEFDEVLKKFIKEVGK